MPDKVKNFYDNLLESGKYDQKSLGDYQTFSKSLQDSTLAKNFYDNLLDKGFKKDYLGDWNTFYSNVHGGQPQQAQPTEQADTTGVNDFLKQNASAISDYATQRAAAEKAANDKVPITYTHQGDLPEVTIKPDGDYWMKFHKSLGLKGGSEDLHKFKMLTNNLPDDMFQNGEISEEAMKVAPQGYLDKVKEKKEKENKRIGWFDKSKNLGAAEEYQNRPTVTTYQKNPIPPSPLSGAGYPLITTTETGEASPRQVQMDKVKTLGDQVQKLGDYMGMLSDKFEKGDKSPELFQEYNKAKKYYDAIFPEYQKLSKDFSEKEKKYPYYVAPNDVNLISQQTGMPRPVLETFNSSIIGKVVLAGLVNNPDFSNYKPSEAEAMITGLIGLAGDTGLFAGAGKLAEMGGDALMKGLSKLPLKAGFTDALADVTGKATDYIAQGLTRREAYARAFEELPTQALKIKSALRGVEAFNSGGTLGIYNALNSTITQYQNISNATPGTEFDGKKIVSSDQNNVTLIDKQGQLKQIPRSEYDKKAGFSFGQLGMSTAEGFLSGFSLPYASGIADKVLDAAGLNKIKGALEDIPVNGETKAQKLGRISYNFLQKTNNLAAGGIRSFGRLAAQAYAFAAVKPMLEGRAPTSKEFMQSLIFLGGMNASMALPRLGGVLKGIYQSMDADATKELSKQQVMEQVVDMTAKLSDPDIDTKLNDAYEQHLDSRFKDIAKNTADVDIKEYSIDNKGKPVIKPVDYDGKTWFLSKYIDDDKVELKRRNEHGEYLTTEASREDVDFGKYQTETPETYRERLEPAVYSNLKDQRKKGKEQAETKDTKEDIKQEVKAEAKPLVHTSGKLIPVKIPGDEGLWYLKDGQVKGKRILPEKAGLVTVVNEAKETKLLAPKTLNFNPDNITDPETVSEAKAEQTIQQDKQVEVAKDNSNLIESFSGKDMEFPEGETVKTLEYKDGSWENNVATAKKLRIVGETEQKGLYSVLVDGKQTFMNENELASVLKKQASVLNGTTEETPNTELKPIPKDKDGNIRFKELLKQDPVRYISEFDKEFGEGMGEKSLQSMVNALDKQINTLKSKVNPDDLKITDPDKLAQTLRKIKALEKDKETLANALKPKENEQDNKIENPKQEAPENTSTEASGDVVQSPVENGGTDVPELKPKQQTNEQPQETPVEPPAKEKAGESVKEVGEERVPEAGKKVEKPIEQPKVKEHEPSKNYTVLHEKGKYRLVKDENGNVVVIDKDGNIPKSKSVASRMITEYRKKGDFDKGKLAVDNTTEEEGRNYGNDFEGLIADHSQNPAEVLWAMNRVPKFVPIEERDATDRAIFESMTPINPESFTRFGDKNNVTMTIAKNYFKSKANGGRGIDQWAQEASGELYPNGTGNEITPDDIVNFIMKYDNIRKFTNEYTRIYNDLYGKFLELTGISPSDMLIKRYEKWEPKDNSNVQEGKDLSDEANEQELRKLDKAGLLPSEEEITELFNTQDNESKSNNAIPKEVSPESGNERNGNGNGAEKPGETKGIVSETPKGAEEQQSIKFDNLSDVLREEPKQSELKDNIAEAEKEPTKKEPWEMTKEDFINSEIGKKEYTRFLNALSDGQKKNFAYPYGSTIDVLHRKAVEQALSEGKPVPEEVLKDYPDLKPSEESLLKSAKTIPDLQELLALRKVNPGKAYNERMEELRNGLKNSADDFVSEPDAEYNKKAREEAGYTSESGKVDETTNMERVAELRKGVSFVDPDKGPSAIRNSGDVAVLFKNLESASSENAFAVFVDKDGNYKVLYIGTGGSRSTVIDPKKIAAFVKDYGANDIYLIHNHPSGNLIASPADLEMSKDVRDAVKLLGVDNFQSLIINLDSGKYSIIDIDNKMSNEAETPNAENANSPVEVYSFDRQKLYVNSSEKTKIKSSQDVATFLSKQKRGTTDKIRALVLDQSNKINKVILYDETTNPEELLKSLMFEVAKHGEQVILSGNVGLPKSTLKLINDGLSKISSGLLDYIKVNPSEDIVNNYLSYADEGKLSENKEEYGKESEDDLKFKLTSPTESAAISIKQPKGEPAQMQADLLRNGAKQAELDWMGWDDFVKGKDKLTKEEIQKWIKENKVELREVVKGSNHELINKLQSDYDALSNKFNDAVKKYGSDNPIVVKLEEEMAAKKEEIISAASNPPNTKYSQYKTPGGTNYREFLLTLNIKNELDKLTKRLVDKYGRRPKYKELTDDEKKEYRKIKQFRKDVSESFISSHFDEPNIVVHTRTQDFKDADGDLDLHLDEIQSDLSERIRKLEVKKAKGTISNDELKELDRLKKITPFEKTPQWVGLGLKRMVQEAAENGYDAVTWTTGEQQAERYDLSKQVSKINVVKTHDGTYTLGIFDKNNKNISQRQDVTDNDLPNYVGKELAEKISLLKNGEAKVYSGLDLKVGGEGMTSFYDNILPNTAKKLFKKYGAKVEKTTIIGEDGQEHEAWKLKLTPELRREATTGFPMFREITRPPKAKTVTEALSKEYVQGLKEFESTARTEIHSLADNLGVNVKIYQSERDLPRAYRKAIKENVSDGQYTPGFYVAKPDGSGEVVIVLSNVHSISEARRTVFHEFVGHKGLRLVFKDKYNNLLEDVYRHIPEADIIRIKNKYSTQDSEGNILHIPDIYEVADEWLAEKAETITQQPSWLQNAYARIRNWVRHLTGLKYTQADLASLFDRSRKALQKEKIRELKRAGYSDFEIRRMTVWHGGPNDFDRFDFSHVGEGEGAQAFGHGGYFADRMRIAMGYARMGGLPSITHLSVKDVPVYDNKKPYNYNSNRDGQHKAALIEDLLINEGKIKEAFDKSKEDGLKAVQDIFDDQITSAKNEMEYDKEYYSERIKFLESKKPGKVSDIKYEAEGNRNLYKVKIHGDKTADELNFVRWDKNITPEQRKSIAKQLKAAGYEDIAGAYNSEGYNPGTGQKVYQSLSKVLGSDKAASDFLLKAGIDGIKYPSEYTSKGSHEDSFNYVVFDDKSIEIEGHVRFKLIGEKGAKNLDKDKEEAEKLEKEGIPAEQIKKKTNWERGVDGKWRYEISDGDLKKTLKEVEGKELPLSEVVDEKELLKAYPELKGTKIIFYDSHNSTGGFADPEKKVIGIAVGDRPSRNKKGIPIYAYDNASLKSVLSHEIQHLIQPIEGFEPGTNRKEVWENLIKDKLQQFKERGWYQNFPEERQRQIAEGQIWDEVGTEYHAYRKAAGEVEARNVQKRLGLTNEERRNTPIESTEDIPRKDQIKVKGSSFSSLSDVLKEPKEEPIPPSVRFKVSKDATKPLYEMKDIWEKSKDDWFGEKDVHNYIAGVEASNFQDGIKEDWKKNEKKYKELGAHNWRDIDMAIHIYLDMQADPQAKEKYYNDLTKRQQQIVNLAENLSDNIKFGVAAKIRAEYEIVGKDALQAGAIRNLLDNYVAHMWRLKKGQSGTELWKSFATATKHAKQRTLGTILEGWARKDENGKPAGLELAVEGATNNLKILKSEIYNVIANKRLIDEGLKTKDVNGRRMFVRRGDYIPQDYRKVDIPGFVKWKLDKKLSLKRKAKPMRDENVFIDNDGNVYVRHEIYAPEPIAKEINKILDRHDFQGKFGWLARVNAVIKRRLLSFSAFHYMAYTRSYMLAAAIRSPKDFNPIKGMHDGQQFIKSLSPEMKLLVRNGLTLGELYDWNESYAERSTKVSRWFEQNNIDMGIRRKINNLYKWNNDMLFKKYGAGLKAKAAILELRYLQKRYPNKDVGELAKMVANLVNDDFGGLHWGRLGVSKTRQDWLRMTMLAPDWTISNIRTMTQAIRAGSAEERRMYQRFWLRSLQRIAFTSITMNLALAFYDPDEDTDGYWNTVKKVYKDAFENPEKFHWLMADVTPIYRRLFGGEKYDRYGNEVRKYFNVPGHFGDPFKWIRQMVEREPLQPVKAKASVIVALAINLLTGRNWRNYTYTTLSEALGRDDKGKYEHKVKNPNWKVGDPPEDKYLHWAGDPMGGKHKWQLTRYALPSDPSGLSAKQYPSFALAKARSWLPIPLQNFLSWSDGEYSAFDALTHGIGFHSASETIKKPDLNKQFKLVVMDAKMILNEVGDAKYKNDWQKMNEIIHSKEYENAIKIHTQLQYLKDLQEKMDNATLDGLNKQADEYKRMIDARKQELIIQYSK